MTLRVMLQFLYIFLRFKYYNANVPLRAASTIVRSKPFLLIVRSADIETFNDSLEIIYEFLHFRRDSKTLPDFELFFIEEITKKSISLPNQLMQEFNFQKLYKILPPYLCALLGFKCLKK